EDPCTCRRSAGSERRLTSLYSSNGFFPVTGVFGLRGWEGSNLPPIAACPRRREAPTLKPRMDAPQDPATPEADDADGAQLPLLPFRNPLDERFGREFFRSVPDTPGVYRMFGENGLL